MDCVRNGTLIGDDGGIRSYYKDMQIKVGACDGVEVTIVYAEWVRSSGSVHGYPISEKKLAKKKRHFEQ